MDPDPRRRVSAEEALQHEWIVQHAGKADSVVFPVHGGLEALSLSTAGKDEACTIS